VANIRRAAVAGSWYPNSTAALAEAVDGHLRGASATSPGAADPDSPGRSAPGDLVGLMVPHAGLMYSGPVAAHAYRLLHARSFDVAVLVGPSHFVGFDGVAMYASGGFETPFGVAEVDEEAAADLLRISPAVRADAAPHSREHSLEMQLPFLQRLDPDLKIVPLLMGYQTASTADTLAVALATALRGRRALLVASTDLSHYRDRATAVRLDSIVIDCVGRLDPDALQGALDRCPDHACGGGPAVAVMRAAKALGATESVVLNYADSGDISGDQSSVVGYLAAAFVARAGNRARHDR
jgi:AmmeMemoRadiSam system protein B